ARAVTIASKDGLWFRSRRATLYLRELDVPCEEGGANGECFPKGLPYGATNNGIYGDAECTQELIPLTISCADPHPTLASTGSALRGLPPDAVQRLTKTFFRDYRTNPPGCTEREGVGLYLPASVGGSVTPAMPKVTGRDSIID